MKVAMYGSRIVHKNVFINIFLMNERATEKVNGLDVLNDVLN